MEVAKIILQQLGGNKFIAMTGSKNFAADKNMLRMDLTRNGSGANRLEIKLNALDTYDLHFYRLAKSGFDFKVTTKKKLEGIYCDQLQEIFTDVTGLYTHL